MICPSCGAANDDLAEVCFTCRTVLAALTQGSIVGGRYEVLSPLGRGGMGSVYRAHDRVLDETVALKVLRGDAASAPEMSKRFRSEIKLARRVAHPNVCRIYEYGEDGARQYISMELVEGTNLKEVLKRRGALPRKEACDVAAQVAEGLEAIHRVGIVHRDLKTLNVMIDAQGAAKVMDFGIAKKVAGEGTAAPSGSYVVGSPEYMSPEQARGHPVDSRSDIYALGIIVFELFTGQVPFRGDTPVATLLMQLEAPPPLDGPAATAIPAALRPVLSKALAKDPAARYARVREMAEALRAAREASPGARSSAVPPVGPKRRRFRLALAATAVVTIAVLGLLSRGRGGIPTPEKALAPVSPPATLPAGPAPSAPASPVPPTVRARPAPGASRAPGPAPMPAINASPPPSAAPAPTATTEAVSPSPATVAGPATPVPSPSPSSPPSPSAGTDGWLLVLVRPWADVTVDDRPVAQTPLARLPLRPGMHSVVLSNPAYQDFHRKVTIRAGEVYTLDVDLPTEGVRHRR